MIHTPLETRGRRRIELFFFLLFFFVMMMIGETRGGEPPPPVLLALVECSTTVSQFLDSTTPIVIEVYSNWSPIGARRFLHLVKVGYYDNSPLFRVVKKPGNIGSIVQFGISLNKQLEKEWGNQNIPDDPNLGFPFERGFISYGGGGYNSRSSQIFIAFSAERTRHLGKVPWETPFAKVVSGMEIVDQFYCGTDGLDMPPWGNGPKQGRIKHEGLSYLQSEFPELDYLVKCEVVHENRDPMPELHEVVLAKTQWRPLEKKNKEEKPQERNEKKDKEKERRENREERQRKREERKKELGSKKNSENRKAFLENLKSKKDKKNLRF